MTVMVVLRGISGCNEFDVKFDVVSWYLAKLSFLVKLPLVNNFVLNHLMGY